MGPKAKSLKTEVEVVVPQATLVTAPLQGADPSELPFKEWSDQEVNSEKWTADSGKGKPKTPVDANEGPALFEDPQVVHLPTSIVAHEWKRPAQVYPEVQFTIFDDKPTYPDLISGSKHLLHSEFVRSFISSVETLMYLGNTEQFTGMEFATPTYSASTGDSPWRPWHHVYSNCKVGKGKEHAPVVNTIGKYIVRLFWMGAWRKIYVDDLLPVDMIDHVLLPSLELTKEEQEKLAPPECENPPPTPATASTSKGSEKSKAPPVKVIEIWPFLLSKALLKIASLSWYDDREILDFDIIHCLTGWVPQKLNTKGLSISDIWEICSAYTNHFCWPTDKSETGTKSSKKSNASNKGKGALDDLDAAVNAHHLMARCNDMRNFDEDEVLDISPCWSHYFLIDQTRDIPLIKPTLTADLAFWKRFRWLDWAVEKGLISPEENMEQIRCFKLVSPFKKIYEHVVYKQPSKLAIEIEEAVHIVEELDKKKGKDKGKDKGKPKSEKSSKGSQSSKDSKGKKKIDLSQIPDPSIWVDYEKLSSQINAVTIYFKPSKFKSKIKISDLAQAGKTQAPKKKGDASAEWKFLINPKALRDSRNEPIYVFTDSVDYKLLVINLVQTGYTPIFDKQDDADLPHHTDEITECEFCVASLIKRIKRNITKLDKKTFINVTPQEPKPIVHDRPKAHLVLQKFDWQTEALGDMVSSMSTYAVKTTALDLCPGRHVFKLWIKSDTSYVIYVLSDTEVVAGPLEAIMFSLSQESQLLMSMCIDVASSFGRLVQAFGMPEFPLQLKDFYGSYKPNCFLTKAECNKVHDVFYNLLYKVVSGSMSEIEIRALKILFLKWQLPREVFNQVEPMHLCNCYEEEEDFEFMKAMERYVVKIQYFFLGVYERSLMKHHRPEHKNYFKTFSALKTIYVQLFSADKRLKTCPTFFRNFLNHPDISEIKNKYRVTNDLDNVVSLHDITGTVTVPENDWTFICRQQFFVISPHNVLLRINLFCDLSRYLVRVIDNDTKKEMKRYTNNVTVNEYESNIYGYTVLCYGWSTTAMKLNYKLCFAIKKEVNENKLLVPALDTKEELITGNYIPNINNYICKYFVQVPSDKTLLTIRFWTCYEDVLVNLRLLDDYGVLIQEITGKKNIVLPAVVLEYHEKPEKAKMTSDLSLKLRKFSLDTSSIKSKSKSSKSSKRSEKGSSKSLVRSKRSSLSQSKNSGESVKPIASDFSRSLTEVEEEPPGTVYVIEAVVLDDTWPLKIEEWRGVSSLKAEMLYGPTYLKEILDAERPLSKKSIETSLESMKIRSFYSASQSQYSQSEESLTVQYPHWILQTICNADDPVGFVKDTRRENTIRHIKSRWYKPDPMRYVVSQDLRQMYLEENKIPNEDVPHDTADVRSLDPNFFAKEILPPYDLSGYMVRRQPEVKIEEIQVEENKSTSSESALTALLNFNRVKGSIEALEARRRTIEEESNHITYTYGFKDKSYCTIVFEEEQTESPGWKTISVSSSVSQIVNENSKLLDEDTRILKTESDFEKDIQTELGLLEKFEATHQKLTEDMNNFVAEQTSNFEILDKWFDECREESVIMMEYALSLKDDYVQNVLDEIEKAKAKEAEAKAKESQKDKKGGKKKK